MACGNRRKVKGSTYCMGCLSFLPFTDFHLKKQNDLTDRFVKRANIVTGMALFKFFEISPIQKMIHSIKYKGRSDIAIELGQQLGRTLLKSDLYKDLDVIVPVPLHTKRFRTRGFNQSEQIARGISSVLDIPVAKNVLKRIRNTETQVNKTRYERIQNLENAIELYNALPIVDKTILLVDDIITTGTTAIACTNELDKVENKGIYLAALGLAVK